MSKNVLVISTSLRKHSNSEILAQAFADGAKENGNNVEFISLKEKKIAYCRGCLACQRTKRCTIEDDAIEITEKMKNADVIVFATPIYYYGMSGQMKTLLDRANSLYDDNYHFREIYLISTAAMDDDSVPERTLVALGGWIACFNGVELKDSIFCGGCNEAGEVKNSEAVREAFDMGCTL